MGVRCACLSGGQDESPTRNAPGYLAGIFLAGCFRRSKLQTSQRAFLCKVGCRRAVAGRRAQGRHAQGAMVDSISRTKI